MIDKDILKYSLGANMYVRGIIDADTFKKKLLLGEYSADTITLDLEDSLGDTEYEFAYNNVLRLLDDLDSEYSTRSDLPYILIRVRDTVCYDKLLVDLRSISHTNILKGIVLPKYEVGEYDLQKVSEYKGLYVLPILESYSIYQKETRYNELNKLKDDFDTNRDIILGLRVGIMDYLNYMGVRRPYGNNYISVYGNANIKGILGDIINYFGDSYVISGGVTDNYKDTSILRKDIELDKFNGFIGKTVVHPNQVSSVQYGLKVNYTEYKDALKVLNDINVMSSDAKGSSMLESKVMKSWATKTITLASIYGIKFDCVDLCEDMDLKKANKLFTIGLRNGNSKREHLIISKVIGKHIAVDPSAVKLVGLLLFIGDLLEENTILKDRTTLEILYSRLVNNLYKGVYTVKSSIIGCISSCIDDSYISRRYCVVGFCETATGISRAYYDVANSIFSGSVYLSSTRYSRDEIISDIEIKFTESHSHLSNHSLFIRTDKMFNITDKDRLILVDDEYTTGRTVSKLIDKIKTIYNFNSVGICSVIRGNELIDVNWDSKFSILEHTYKLTNTGNTNVDNIIEKDITDTINKVCISYYEDKRLQGSSGFTCDDLELYTKRVNVNVDRILNDCDKLNSILIVGVGEYMSLGIDIGVELSKNLSVKYKSITKSPIYVDNYTIHSRDTVRWCDVEYYYYNFEDDLKNYDKIIFVGYK